MIGDLPQKTLIFVFGILRVEDAVLLPPQTYASEDILARGDIERIADMMGLRRAKAKLDVVAAGTGGCFVHQLAVAAPAVFIHRIVMEFDVPYVSTAGTFLCAKTLVAVFALRQVIAAHIFALGDGETPTNRFAADTGIHFFCDLHHRARTEIKFLELLLISLFRQLLIEEAVALIAEVTAHKAVTAAAAVQKKSGRRAFHTKEEIATVLALQTLDAFIEVRTVGHLRAIHTVIRSCSAIRVEKIL